MSTIDHLIYATPDLGATVADLESKFGVTPTVGGTHPGEGTRNVLYNLGPGCYLEVMGPDPEQSAPPRPRWLGIDDLTEPRLVTWAARSDDFDSTVALAHEAELGVGLVLTGGRMQPNGVVLSWRLTNPRAMLADGVLPFFIDWGDSPHPSSTAVEGLRLVSFDGEHPEPTAIQEIADQLELPLVVSAGPVPRLKATLESPNGLVILT